MNAAIVNRLDIAEQVVVPALAPDAFDRRFEVVGVCPRLAARFNGEALRIVVDLAGLALRIDCVDADIVARRRTNRLRPVAGSSPVRDRRTPTVVGAEHRRRADEHHDLARMLRLGDLHGEIADGLEAPATRPAPCVRTLSPKAGVNRSIAAFNAALSPVEVARPRLSGMTDITSDGPIRFTNFIAMSRTRKPISARVVRLSSTTTMKRPSGAASAATNVAISTGRPSSKTWKSSAFRPGTIAPFLSTTTAGTTIRSELVVKGGTGCWPSAARLIIVAATKTIKERGVAELLTLHSALLTDKDHFVIVPHAIRSPAAPPGSVFMSSAVGVDHQRGAAVGVDRVGLAVLHRDLVVGDRGLGVALGVHGEVHHVAGVRTLGVLHAVLLGGGIEVRARAGERRLALGDRVDVNRVLAGRQALQVERDRDAALGAGGNHRHADRVALGVLDIDMLHALCRHAEDADGARERNC